MSFQASVSDIERGGQRTGAEDIRDLCQRKPWELNAEDNYPHLVVAVPPEAFDFQVDENLEGKDSGRAVKELSEPEKETLSRIFKLKAI